MGYKTYDIEAPKGSKIITNENGTFEVGMSGSITTHDSMDIEEIKEWLSKEYGVSVADIKITERTKEGAE